MCQSHKRINRRRFLKDVGGTLAAAAAFDPIVYMLEQVIYGNRYSAEAQTLGTADPRNFIMCRMNGAPNRPEQLLNPYVADSTLFPNNYVKNRFTSTGDLAYQTINYAGMNLPYFWGGNIPTPSGTAPLTKLVDNALFIRGIQMADNAHASNQARLLSPAQTEPSIPTLIQRNSNQMITNPNLQTSITSIISNLTTGGGNFIYRNKSDYASVQGAISGAVQAIGDQVKATNLSNAAIYDRFKGVDAQLNGTFFASLTQLVTDFNTAKTKYLALLDKCKNQTNFPFPGLTTKTVIKPKYANWGQATLEGETVGNGNMDIDLAALVGTSGTGVDDFGYGTGVGSTNGYANQFAACEVLMKAGLTKFCTIVSDHIANLTLPAGTPSSISSTWGFDEHGASAAMSLIMQSYHFRAFYSCMYELINQLKAAGIFNNTVIMVGSEFTRGGANDIVTDASSPLNGLPAYNDLSHQGQGNAFAIYSGMVQTPVCIGNIQAYNLKNFGTAMYSGSIAATKAQAARGTTGWAGKLVMNDGTVEDPLTFKAFSSTVTSMLGLEPIFSNFKPIVTVNSSNKFVMMVPNGQNVDPLA
ncbi:MAG: hypothetical protein JST80_01800 [Bdellovibrionales bacterium]|nr:hypothetical protein [Bdellovibrionales bacterium]